MKEVLQNTPNSPDLNPLDFSVWGMWEAATQRLAKERGDPMNDDQLRALVVAAWCDVTKGPAVFRNMIENNFVKLLTERINVNGGHFEASM